MMKRIFTLLVTAGILSGCTASLLVAEGGQLFISEGGAVTLDNGDLIVDEGGRLDLKGNMDVTGGDAVIAGDVYLELRGADDYGRMEVSSTASLTNGQLTVELADGYQPQTRTTYNWLTTVPIGPFETEVLPSPVWFTEYSNEEGGKVIFDAALPVEWLFFRGEARGKSSLLSWATAAETNTDRFGVERMSPVGLWQEIGSVNAAGSRNEYQFIDEEPGPTNPVLYRLRQIDLNEDFTYSDIAAVQFPHDEGIITASPNPTSGPLTITIPSRPDNDVTYRIINSLGQRVLQGVIPAGQSTIGLSLAQKLSAGTYFLNIGEESLPIILR